MLATRCRVHCLFRCRCPPTPVSRLRGCRYVHSPCLESDSFLQDEIRGLKQEIVNLNQENLSMKRQHEAELRKEKRKYAELVTTISESNTEGHRVQLSEPSTGSSPVQAWSSEAGISHVCSEPEERPVTKTDSILGALNAFQEHSHKSDKFNVTMLHNKARSPRSSPSLIPSPVPEQIIPKPFPSPSVHSPLLSRQVSASPVRQASASPLSRASSKSSGRGIRTTPLRFVKPPPVMLTLTAQKRINDAKSNKAKQAVKLRKPVRKPSPSPMRPPPTLAPKPAAKITSDHARYRVHSNSPQPSRRRPLDVSPRHRPC
eukprot:TRINITY_DN9723_c0_g1_i2.p1 TRINITY_DN9723_c0_g1~~TRINITY_DN9723_c0_g1_i2.p1  ORF type:complete len:316 (+),score=40.83 TRINITY_DN9723_c0_g1_i2:73-1020(+)